MPSCQSGGTKEKQQNKKPQQRKIKSLISFSVCKERVERAVPRYCTAKTLGRDVIPRHKERRPTPEI